jgi:hypothetical protein
MGSGLVKQTQNISTPCLDTPAVGGPVPSQLAQLPMPPVSSSPPVHPASPSSAKQFHPPVLISSSVTRAYTDRLFATRAPTSMRTRPRVNTYTCNTARQNLGLSNTDESPQVVTVRIIGCDSVLATLIA